MSKLETCIADKLYTIRKKYPVIKEFECRMREVEKELNKDHAKKNVMCDSQRKPMCENVCKNRQKR